ncbi:MAG: hypothetical protein A3F42_00120 [Gammaproteobacteria bacterium RIFCSPHIGHO2_12_FULL_37_34]|nr:MAG: hypothetical protein A3F42_00120 [Gammaproteobacteria bacterium RIFCSPHIGHO2_12_FULL_37_34]
MNNPKTTFSAIVALSENRLIGKNNRLPWHLPADLKHFKKMTTGYAIVMGRKTFLSIGKPLPNRINIVMTRNSAFHAKGCVMIHSIQEGIDWAISHAMKKIFVIGGADIYQQWLPYIQCIYMTIVHGQFTGDVYFPPLNNEWKEIKRTTHRADKNNPYAYSFITLKRKHKK